MDINAIAASSGIALALSVAANIAQWQDRKSLLRLVIDSIRSNADMASAQKESNTLVQRLLGDRAR